MICKEAQKEISRQRDREEPAVLESAVGDHVQSCPDCARFSVELRRIDEGVSGIQARATETLSPDEVFVATLRSRIAEAEEPRILPWRRLAEYRWPVGTVAAVLVLTLMAWLIPLVLVPPVPVFAVEVESLETDVEDGILMLYQSPDEEITTVWLMAGNGESAWSDTQGADPPQGSQL